MLIVPMYGSHRNLQMQIKGLKLEVNRQILEIQSANIYYT